MSKIYKEAEIFNADYCAKLDNGTLIFVIDSVGYGSDGKVYYYEDVEVDEDEFEFVGWRCDG